MTRMLLLLNSPLFSQRIVCSIGSLKPTDLFITRYFTSQRHMQSCSNDKFIERLKHRLKCFWRTFKAWNVQPLPNFDPMFVESSYKRDGVSAREWLLVHNDYYLSKVASVASYAVSFFVFVFLSAILDYVQHEGTFSVRVFRQLHDSILMMGKLSWICPITIVLYFMLMARLKCLHLGRIYVNRADPNRVCVLVSNRVFTKKLKEIDRKEIRCLSTFYDSVDFRYVLQILVNGQVRLGKLGGCIVNENAFRSNPLRSFVLQERKWNGEVPRELKVLDLDIVDDRKEKRRK